MGVLLIVTDVLTFAKWAVQRKPACKKLHFMKSDKKRFLYFWVIDPHTRTCLILRGNCWVLKWQISTSRFLNHALCSYTRVFTDASRQVMVFDFGYWPDCCLFLYRGMRLKILMNLKRYFQRVVKISTLSCSLGEISGCSRNKFR